MDSSTEPEPELTLATVPHDVLFHILSFVEPVDLYVLGTASRGMRFSTGTDAQLWRSLLRRNYHTADRAFAALDALFVNGETRRPFSNTPQANWFRALWLTVLNRYGKHLGWWISDRPFVGELMKASLTITADEPGAEPRVGISYKKLSVENLAEPTFVTCGSVLIGPSNMPIFSLASNSAENSSIIGGTWTALSPVTINMLKERVWGTDVFALRVPNGLLPRWTDDFVPAEDHSLKPQVVCLGPYSLRRNRDKREPMSAAIESMGSMSLSNTADEHPADARFYRTLEDSAKLGSGRLAARDLFNDKNKAFLASSSHFAIDCPRSCHSYISHNQASVETINDIRPGEVGLMFDPNSLAGQPQPDDLGVEGELLEDIEDEEAGDDDDLPDAAPVPDDPEANRDLRPVSRPTYLSMIPHIPHTPLKTPRGPVFPPRYFPLKLQQPIPRRFARYGLTFPQPGEEGWEPEQLTGLWISTYRTRPPAFLSVQIQESPSQDTEEPIKKLVAHKLTGNPNVPRGEKSFTAIMRAIPPGQKSAPVIDEDESGGVDAVYQHLPPPGASEWMRVKGVKVKFPAWKQFATPAFRNSHFSQSELLVISNDEFCVYSLKHGHVTRYRRMPTDV